MKRLRVWEVPEATQKNPEFVKMVNEVTLSGCNVMLTTGKLSDFKIDESRYKLLGTNISEKFLDVYFNDYELND